MMKRHFLPAGAFARARRLRGDTTDAERRLWLALREGLPEARFRRQVPLGAYVADFCSHGAKLVVEVDGSQHGKAEAYDAARTRFLEGEGYRVLRFWNNEVLENLEGVLTAIVAALPELPPRKRVREEQDAFVSCDGLAATPLRPPSLPISLPPCGGEVGEGGAARSAARAEGAPDELRKVESLRERAGRPLPSTPPSLLRGEGARPASAPEALRAPSLRDGTPLPLPSPTRGEGEYDNLRLESV